MIEIGTATPLALVVGAVPVRRPVADALLHHLVRVLVEVVAQIEKELTAGSHAEPITPSATRGPGGN